MTQDYTRWLLLWSL